MDIYNVVDNESYLNLVDICLYNTLQTSCKSLQGFIKMLEIKRANLTQFYRMSVILVSKSKLLMVLSKKRNFEN